MTDTQDVFKQGLEQMTALTRDWLKTPDLDPTAGAGANVKKFTALATDLEQLYTAACQSHMDPLLQGNREIAERFAALTRSRNPQDIVDFQLELLALMMEAASIRAAIWGELADKVGHRYAEFAREMADNLHAAAAAEAAAGGAPRTTPSPAPISEGRSTGGADTAAAGAAKRATAKAGA